MYGRNVWPGKMHNDCLDGNIVIAVNPAQAPYEMAAGPGHSVGVVFGIFVFLPVIVRPAV